MNFEKVRGDFFKEKNLGGIDVELLYIYINIINFLQLQKIIRKIRGFLRNWIIINLSDACFKFQMLYDYDRRVIGRPSNFLNQKRRKEEERITLRWHTQRTRGGRLTFAKLELAKLVSTQNRWNYTRFLALYRVDLSRCSKTRDVDFSFFVLDSMTHLKFYSALFDFYEMNAQKKILISVSYFSLKNLCGEG